MVIALQTDADLLSRHRGLVILYASVLPTPRAPAFAGPVLTDIWAGAGGPGRSRLLSDGRDPRYRTPNYLRILITRPAPTVLPPSRIAKRRPSSIAIGW